MNNLSKILKDDFEKIINIPCIDWERLANKTILITGASGLIGSNIINAILYANETRKYNIKIFAVVRSIEKALKKLYIWQNNKENLLVSIPFSNCYNIDDDKKNTCCINKINRTIDNINFITCDIESFKEIDGDVDYIIHAANPTSSKFFVEKPVETITNAIIGTKNLLEIAKYKKVKSFVFLSSMEVYGNPQKGKEIYEDYVAGFDPNVTRNSYPMSKKICESLCKAYSSEFGVPTKIIRLTQTFGPGVEYNDGRIFAEFMRCVIEKRDIVLKTKGETERCYLYTIDAVSAILAVMLSGEIGECYNAANPSTYCSIAEMAELVANRVAEKSIKVNWQCVEDIQKLGYADTLYMNLNIEKILKLKWNVTKDLYGMFYNMINTVARP